MTKTLTISFDEQNHQFTFGGDVEFTTSGVVVKVPFSTGGEPTDIRLKRLVNTSFPWNFDAISVLGLESADPSFNNAWRTVTAVEIPPSPDRLPLVSVPGVVTLEVSNLGDDLVIWDTNEATQVNVGWRLQVTIKDANGARWTSPDPQVINEKEEN